VGAVTNNAKFRPEPSTCPDQCPHRNDPSFRMTMSLRLSGTAPAGRSFGATPVIDANRQVPAIGVTSSSVVAGDGDPDPRDPPEPSASRAGRVAVLRDRTRRYPPETSSRTTETAIGARHAAPLDSLGVPGSRLMGSPAGRRPR